MKKLLIIEDEKIHADNFREKVNTWVELGYIVVSNDKFENEYTTLQDFKSNILPSIINLVDRERSNLDAVFLDLVFKIEGKETLEGFTIGKHIRERHFDLPIIIFSQLKPEMITEKGLIFDLDGYIPKIDWGQFTSSRFKGVIDFAIEKRKAMIKNIFENPERIFQASKYYAEKTVPETGEIVFIIMPFDKKIVSNDVYRIGIQDAIAEFNNTYHTSLQCVRVDEDLFSEPIMNKIFTYVKKARLIIAILTQRNANVFYELGMSHMLNKDVIMLTKDINDVPFDVRTTKCHQYEEGDASILKSKVIEILRKYFNK